MYPYSNQANSVVDVLRFALNRPNIQLETGAEVIRAEYRNRNFFLKTKEKNYTCDRLIIACGGLAGTGLGGSPWGYKLLRNFGHTVTRLRPSLVQIRTDWHGVTALKGVRANCHVKIYKNTQLFSESTGELQFTDIGLSGPVMFEISRDVCYEKADWSAVLDFLPDVSSEDLFLELKRRTGTNLPTDEILTGILHNRLGRVIAKASDISSGQPVSSLREEELEELCRQAKAFRVSLREPLGMDAAQVTAGGIRTEEFNELTMESRLVPGLYACGEVLDIDGDCGGYNLQWAWSSGRLAGEHAGKAEK